MILYLMFSMARISCFVLFLSCILPGLSKGSDLDRDDRQAGPVWPQGTYGLMKMAHGCPLGGTTWSQGWLYQDTEDHHPETRSSPELSAFLAASVNSHGVRTEYCIKENDSNGTTDWPKGSYCILKHGTCPTGIFPCREGFQAGWIHWDDEDDHNKNQHSGVLPDGTYNRNTMIYYCCRNDANDTDIFLPTDHPFVLIRYGSHCQNVEGMEFRDVFIHWDDEDDSNRDGAGGLHPYDASGNRNNELHFCVYTIHGAIIG